MKFNIVIKIVLPLILGLFLISSISIYSFYYLLEKNIEDKSYQAFTNVNLTLEHTIEQDTNLMIELLQQLQKDKYSIQLFQNKNREWLFMYLYQTFSELKAQYGLTHFYIHNIDKKNFVRIHNREKHSDIIDRITLEKAKKSFSVSSGIEFGVHHNLTLRIVSPWFVNGELIGFIELGKEIDKFTPKLSKLLNADIIFTIDKRLITPKDFNVWVERAEHNRFYKEMNNYYIIDSTINTIDRKLESFLDSKLFYSGIAIKNDEKTYYMNSKNFFDVNEQKIGRFHVLIDSSKEHEFLYELIVKISIIIFCILLFIVSYYIKYIQKTENKLNQAYIEIQKIATIDSMTTLFNKNHYLTEASQQLQRASRNEHYISFILIDADNFKQYNDYYGHLKGDEALKSIAITMKQTFKRATDICYRVGGEEFLIIVEHEHKDEAFKRTEVLCKRIENLDIEHKYNNKFSKITISSGVYTCKAIKKLDRNICYEKADKALYLSKNSGKNKVTLFQEEKA